MSAKKDVILFVGNPGVGKSTLLNSLIGELRFRSGVSFGQGLTQVLQWEEVNGVYYADTPGLSDVKIRKKAGEEIEKALKKDGSYRLIFIGTSESGRVRCEDLTTMQLVLEALPKDVVYGVIINKLSAKIKKKMDRGMRPGAAAEDRGDFQQFITCLNSGHRPTPHIFFNSTVDELDDENDVLSKAPDELAEFIRDLPRTVIEPTNVKEIDTDKFAQMVERLETKISELMASAANDKIAFQKEMRSQREELLAQMDLLREKAELEAMDREKKEQELNEARQKAEARAEADSTARSKVEADLQKANHERYQALKQQMEAQANLDREKNKGFLAKLSDWWRGS